MVNNNEYKITPQLPISSGFGAETTALETVKDINLNGKIAIVTGGHSGIGLETTRALAAAGATVIVAARSPEQAGSALAGIAGIEIEKLDLSDPASIDKFAQLFLTSGRQLDFLFANAGIMAPPLVRDARGYESQFATNHLGHFQLTLRLWTALKQAGNARVVSLSSAGVRFGGVDFEDPNFEKREYDKWKAYGQSKSANALFAVGLDKRGYADGIRAFSVHPGRIDTELARFLSDQERGVGGVFKTTEQGAATSVWCATSQQLEGKGGVYCLDCDIAELVADFKMGDMSQQYHGVLPWAVDPDMAERLWIMSEKMTGVKIEG
ncbi:SDR family NAD(P)-dependent oxidoreductase [Paenibacillus sp. WC2504]|uniref:SDR family NAD(P)-dependent oxidoreductase n=1 Tax=Paenibacillus sp. WC2504 TaxID=3461403 RepID=UPI0040457CBD